MNYTSDQKAYFTSYFEKMQLRDKLASDSEVVQFASQVIVNLNNEAELAKEEYIKKYGSFPEREEIERILNTGN